MKNNQTGAGTPDDKATCNNGSSNNKNVLDVPIEKNISIIAVTTPEKLEDPYLEPDPLDYIIKYVSKRVKHEESLIKLALLVMASAYTPNPLNLALESPQSEGKSYTLVEVSKIFPESDVWDLGGMTPQVLTREKGYHVDRETGKNIENEINEIKGELSVLGNSEEDKQKRKELREKLTQLLKGSVKVVNMEGKILLFLEAPNRETFARLRPILSRDKYEIEYKFVDVAYKNGPQVTMDARIRGWPVAIYATADNNKGNMWDQIRSRFIVVSPNMTKEKYKAANEYTAAKYGTISNPAILKKEDKDLQKCKTYIQLLKYELNTKYYQLSEKDYYNPENVRLTWNPMAIKLEKSFPSNMGQHMRDFKYFMALMDISCLFSNFHRPYFEVDGHPQWVVTAHDLKNVTEVFDNYHVFIKIGELPIKVFENIILKMELEHETLDGDLGFTMNELQKELSSNGLAYGKTYVKDNILSQLEQEGLVNKSRSKADKRRYIYVPFQEKYEQISTNSFLKIKYEPEDFAHDFNEIKIICIGMTSITMNSGEFKVQNHFGNDIFFSGKKSLKSGKNSLNNENNKFVHKSSHSNEIQENIGNSQLLLHDDLIIKQAKNVDLDYENLTQIEMVILSELASLREHTVRSLIEALKNSKEDDIKEALHDMYEEGAIEILEGV